MQNNVQAELGATACPDFFFESIRNATSNNDVRLLPFCIEFAEDWILRVLLQSKFCRPPRGAPTKRSLHVCRAERLLELIDENISKIEWDGPDHFVTGLAREAGCVERDEPLKNDQDAKKSCLKGLLELERRANGDARIINAIALLRLNLPI